MRNFSLWFEFAQKHLIVDLSECLWVLLSPYRKEGGEKGEGGKETEKGKGSERKILNRDHHEMSHHEVTLIPSPKCCVIF